MTKWTVYDSGERVLDALATWLQEHPQVRYELSYHEDFLIKKWLASLRPWDGNPDGSSDVDGRGDTAHEATVTMLNRADVPHPQYPGSPASSPYRDTHSGITVDDDLTIRSFRPDEVTREILEGP